MKKNDIIRTVFVKLKNITKQIFNFKTINLVIIGLFFLTILLNGLLYILISLGSSLYIKSSFNYKEIFTYLSFFLSFEITILSCSKKIRNKILFVKKGFSLQFFVGLISILIMPTFYLYFRKVFISNCPPFEDCLTMIFLFISLIYIAGKQIDDNIK